MTYRRLLGLGVKLKPHQLLKPRKLRKSQARTLITKINVEFLFKPKNWFVAFSCFGNNKVKFITIEFS